jgi:hypothetical protein
LDWNPARPWNVSLPSNDPEAEVSETTSLDQGDGPGCGPDELLSCARAHGETSDTRQWVDNLETMVRIAWDLMTEEQRKAFTTHGDILAIVEAAGESPNAIGLGRATGGP